MSPLLVVPSRMLTTARASLYLATAGAALAFGVTASDFLLFGGGGAMLPGVVGADGLAVTGESLGTLLALSALVAPSPLPLPFSWLLLLCS